MANNNPIEERHVWAVLVLFANMARYHSIKGRYCDGVDGVIQFWMELFIDADGFRDKNTATLRAELEKPATAIHHIITAKTPSGLVGPIGQDVPADVAALVTRYLGYLERKGYPFVPGQAHPLGTTSGIKKVTLDGSDLSLFFSIKHNGSNHIANRGFAETTDHSLFKAKNKVQEVEVALRDGDQKHQEEVATLHQKHQEEVARPRAKSRSRRRSLKDINELGTLILTGIPLALAVLIITTKTLMKTIGRLDTRVRERTNEQMND